MSILTARSWSPYAAGIVIGLLQIPAFLLINTALGASSSFVTVAASLAALFDPAINAIPYFKNHVSTAKDWWQVALVAGVALGAFISVTMAGTTRPAMSEIWGRVMGIRSFPARLAIAFAGGFILLLGARIANGCTSGHGLSGLSQLAVSSLIAMAAMFVSGIAASLILKRA
ncbi:MAG: YeeE/YedE family protein [Pseudorhodoplanes sp.]|nr:YeeE/YedE family protein [Pseudorhodoplanes sp.]